MVAVKPTAVPLAVTAATMIAGHQEIVAAITAHAQRHADARAQADRNATVAGQLPPHASQRT